MKTFEIEIQEFLARVEKVKADNVNDAISKVKKIYSKSEIVLDYSDFIGVEFIDINDESKSDEKNRLMNEVITYLFEKEKKHFEELEKPDNHIFTKIEKLKTLLD